MPEEALCMKMEYKSEFILMIILNFYVRKTKMKINIVPLEKIEIDGKSIELGMKKEQVIGILGLGELSNRHFFYDKQC